MLPALSPGEFLAEQALNPEATLPKAALVIARLQLMASHRVASRAALLARLAAV